jgi:tetratricopeptide (TPR) repeat protein
MALLNRTHVIELARKLAHFYPSVEDSKPVVNDIADLDTTTISFDPRGLFNWLSILSEAHRQNSDGTLVHCLLERIRQDFLDEQVVLQALQFEWNHATVGNLITNTINAYELEWQRKLEQIVILPKQTYNPDLDPPSALLQAKYEVVPFQYRGADLESLRVWCESEKRIALRLYHGVGGLGKTRLLLHFCRELKEQGWLSGFLNLEDAEGFLSSWDALLYQDKPMFLVVDYAETRLESLKGLLQTVYRCFGKLPQKLRLVLLARSNGEWWEQLKGESTELGNLLMGAASEVFAMKPVADSLEERQRLYQAAATSFARVLDQPVPQNLTPDLTAIHFERALLVLMDALLALDSFQAKAERTTTGLLEGVLYRERSYWQNQLKGKGFNAGLVPMLDGLENTMALVTLGRRVQNAEQAIELLQQDKNFEGKDYAECQSVVEILHTAYTEPDWVSGLQPDLLGEYLASRVLSKSDLVLSAAFEEQLPAGTHKTGLTILSHLSQWHSDGEKLLRKVLTPRSYLYPYVIEVAPVTGHVIADTLAEIMKQHPNPQLSNSLVDQIPEHTVALRRLAGVMLHQAVIASRDEDNYNRAFELLNKLGIRLSELGQQEQALEVTEDVVKLYRMLVQTQSNSYLLPLADSLNNLGNRLRTAGKDRNGRALSVTREAIDIYRELVKNHPGKYEADLGAGLHSLGMRLNEADKDDEAIGAIEEAVRIRRKLVECKGNKFLPDLAISLNNLGIALSESPRYKEALAITEEAVNLYRALAEKQPDAFTKDLAMSLTNLCKDCRRMDRDTEALTHIEEAIRLYRELTGKMPDSFAPRLALSLLHLGISLLKINQLAYPKTNPRAVLDDQKASSEAMQEGLQLIKPYFFRYPQAHQTLTDQLVQGYLASCKIENIEPDVQLFDPIFKKLEELKQNA